MTCQECAHYDPLKSGEPPAGWCEFIYNSEVPFWMKRKRIEIDRLGADVLASDGEDCGAFKKVER
jgi:hypothetical protein